MWWSSISCHSRLRGHRKLRWVPASAAAEAGYTHTDRKCLDCVPSGIPIGGSTMATATSTTVLKTAIATYPHTKALKDGTVTASGLQFEHFDINPIIVAFRR